MLTDEAAAEGEPQTQAALRPFLSLCIRAAVKALPDALLLFRGYSWPLVAHLHPALSGLLAQADLDGLLSWGIFERVGEASG